MRKKILDSITESYLLCQTNNKSIHQETDTKDQYIETEWPHHKMPKKMSNSPV